MDPGLEDARRWAAGGTELFLASADLDDDAYRAPSALTGWTRKHLVAHVAANAEALGNLMSWAASGHPTPMYSSPEQRGADIEAGSRRPAPELTAWLARSADELDGAMSRLTPEQWCAEVVTAQGRTVPATAVPWMRAREVWVHAVDLASGVGFVDLPTDFLLALGTDVISRRATSAAPSVMLEASDANARWELSGDGTPVLVSGALSELVAYLTGRPHDLSAADGGPVPDLGPWL
jgi:uncharacterized protein (TIGR03083 family)